MGTESSLTLCFSLKHELYTVYLTWHTADCTDMQPRFHLYGWRSAFSSLTCRGVRKHVSTSISTLAIHGIASSVIAELQPGQYHGGHTQSFIR